MNKNSATIKEITTAAGTGNLKMPGGNLHPQTGYNIPSSSRLMRENNYQQEQATTGKNHISHDLLMPGGTLNENWLRDGSFSALRRLTWGRMSGTALYAALEMAVPRSFDRKDTREIAEEAKALSQQKGINAEDARKQVSEYQNQEWFHRLMRSTADVYSHGVDTLVGHGTDKWEKSETFEESANPTVWKMFKKSVKGLQRHDITRDDIESGRYRRRRYGMKQVDLQILHDPRHQELFKRYDLLLWDLEHLGEGESGADIIESLREIRDKNPEIVPVLDANRSYGEQSVRLGVGFAFMGLLDYTVHQSVIRVGRIIHRFDKLLDPAWRNSAEFDEWKASFNLGKEIKSYFYGIFEDFLRGDGITYDMGQLVYPWMKESYGRSQEGISREIKMNEDGNITVEKAGTGKSDFAKLFNVPFVFYNWWGRFVVQDLAVDWWLRKDESRLLNYMDEHKVETGNFLKDIWNTGVCFAAFSLKRTTEIVSYMIPAVSVGFSPWRYYGRNAVDELKIARRHALVDKMANEIYDEIVAVCVEKSPTIAGFMGGGYGFPLDRKDFVDEIQRHLHWMEGKNIPEDMRQRFPETTQHYLLGGYSRENFHQLLVNRAMEITEANVGSSGSEATRQELEGRFHDVIGESRRQFYLNYIYGNRPDVKFTSEANGPIGADGKPTKTNQDELGELVKEYVETHSAALQLGARTAMEFLGKDLEKMTWQELMHIVQWSADAGAAHTGYGPYFAAKDFGAEFVKGNRLVNAVVSFIPNLLEKATFGLKEETRPAYAEHFEDMVRAQIEQGSQRPPHVADEFFAHVPQTEAQAREQEFFRNAQAAGRQDQENLAGVYRATEQVSALNL